jgi:hypothetical protein
VHQLVKKTVIVIKMHGMYVEIIHKRVLAKLQKDTQEFILFICTLFKNACKNFEYYIKNIEWQGDK